MLAGLLCLTLLWLPGRLAGLMGVAVFLATLAAVTVAFLHDITNALTISL